jgi:AcrR family transcriptional regulator
MATARTRRRAAGGAARSLEAPQQRILDAALSVFCEHGFEATTLRQITERAGVNLAAVSYYFGSKDVLVRQTLERLTAPYVAARLAALDACEAAAAGGAPAVGQVVEAIVRPTVLLSRDPKGGRSLIRLLLQVRARPRDATTGFFVERMDPAAHRFVAALSRALPDIGRDVLFWRYSFALGALVQVLTDADPELMRLKRLSEGLCDTDDEEEMIAQLVAFIAAGFSAPPPG